MKLAKLNEMHFEQVLDIFLDPEAAKRQLAVYQNARAEANLALDEARSRHSALDEREAHLNTLDASFDDQRASLAAHAAELAIKARALSLRDEAVQSDMRRNEAVSKELRERSVEINATMSRLEKDRVDFVSSLKLREEAASNALSRANEIREAAESQAAAAEALSQALRARELQLKQLLGG